MQDENGLPKDTRQAAKLTAILSARPDFKDTRSQIEGIVERAGHRVVF